MQEGERNIILYSQFLKCVPNVALYVMAGTVFDLAKIAAAANLVFHKEKINRLKIRINSCHQPVHNVLKCMWDVIF